MAPHFGRRVEFQEATAVVAGAFGSGLGLYAGGVLVASLALTGVGAFLGLGIAGAAVGRAPSESAKLGAGSLYDIFR